jgi:hypothetical protein
MCFGRSPLTTCSVLYILPCLLSISSPPTRPPLNCRLVLRPCPLHHPQLIAPSSSTCRRSAASAALEAAASRDTMAPSAAICCSSSCVPVSSACEVISALAAESRSDSSCATWVE